MLLDLGVVAAGIIYADSSAAMPIANRKGAGKLRHINMRSLRMQEKQDRGEVEYRNVLPTNKFC